MKKITLILLGLTLALLADFTRDSGVVTDNRSTLQWQDNIASNNVTWENAITYCENLTLDAKSDWRLPNITELYSIGDRSKFDPAMDTGAFFFTMRSSNHFYWSSTVRSFELPLVWLIGFQYGSTGANLKTASHYVMCVRG